MKNHDHSRRLAMFFGCLSLTFTTGAYAAGESVPERPPGPAAGTPGVMPDNAGSGSSFAVPPADRGPPAMLQRFRSLSAEDRGRTAAASRSSSSSAASATTGASAGATAESSAAELNPPSSRPRKASKN
jgi:hypothetical protein